MGTFLPEKNTMKQILRTCGDQTQAQEVSNLPWCVCGKREPRSSQQWREMGVGTPEAWCPALLLSIRLWAACNLFSLEAISHL